MTLCCRPSADEYAEYDNSEATLARAEQEATVVPSGLPS